MVTYTYLADVIAGVAKGLYRAMSWWNALPPEVTQAKSKFNFKKQIQKTSCIKVPLLFLKRYCNLTILYKNEYGYSVCRFLLSLGVFPI